MDPASPQSPREHGLAPVTVRRWPETVRERDLLAAEEPLEIRLAAHGSTPRPIAITMRTPGADADLAVGFLFGEGILRSAEELAGLETAGPPAPGTGQHNTLVVHLAEGVAFDADRLQRHFYASSSCGVCGKRSIEALDVVRRHRPTDSGFALAAQALLRLPDALARAQRLFARTGAIHAAATFDEEGRIDAVREDVGRHNAVDKLVGDACRNGTLPWHRRGLLVSGRASFELVQKAAMAGCPLLAAVGGPSSLAVALARETGMALVGFLRENRFNVYSGEERVRDMEAAG